MKKLMAKLMVAMAMISGAANAVPLKLQPADIHEIAVNCNVVINHTDDGYTTETYGNSTGEVYNFTYLDWANVSVRTRGYVYIMVKNHCASR